MKTGDVILTPVGKSKRIAQGNSPGLSFFVK